MSEATKTEILATYAAYVKAFLDNDVAALDRLIQYPLAYIGSGRTTLMDTYPVQPAELIAAKQWHDTKNLNPEVVFFAGDKAQFVLDMLKATANRIRDLAPHHFHREGIVRPSVRP